MNDGSFFLFYLIFEENEPSFIHLFLNILEWDSWDPLDNSLIEFLTLKEHVYLCSFQSNEFLKIVHF